MTNSGACRTSINHWDNFPSHQLCKLNQKNYVQITLRAWHKPRKARQLGAKAGILPSLCPAMHWLFRRQAVHDHHGKAVFLFLPGAPVSANHAMAANRSLRDTPLYSFSWYSISILSRLIRARTYLRCLWGCSMSCSTTTLNTVMLMVRLSYEHSLGVWSWRMEGVVSALSGWVQLPSPRELPAWRNSSYGGPAPLTWFNPTFLVFLYYDMT